MTQIRLGDLLLRAQVVSEAQLNSALAEQKQWGGRLGSILVRMGVLSEDLLVKALARQLNLPRAPIGPADPINVPDAILSRVDRQACEKALVLPIAFVQERRTIVAACADPLNVVGIDDLSRRIGFRLELMLASETQLLQAIARVFAGGTNVGNAASDEGILVDNSGRVMNQRPSPAQAQAQAQAFSQPPVPVSPLAPPQPTFPPQTAPPQYAQPYAQTAPPQFMPAQVPQVPQWSRPSAPATAPRPPGAGADDLRVMAEQQLKAMRALVELLVERGVITRAELAAWLGRA